MNLFLGLYIVRNTDMLHIVPVFFMLLAVILAAGAGRYAPNALAQVADESDAAWSDHAKRIAANPNHHN